MTHGLLVESPRISGRNGHAHLINDLLGRITIIKRDGREVEFVPAKVTMAVARCLRFGVGLAESEAAVQAEIITEMVLYAMASQKTSQWDVEAVQRVVIQQLWVANQFAAAEHYTLYRDQRRRDREAHVISAAEQARFDADNAHFPSPLQYYQFMGKFSRWNEELKRRETWREAVDRVMAFFRRQPKIQLTPTEWQELDDAMYALEASPAMRIVQMAGPSLDRCHTGAYNCAYAPFDDLFAFAEHLYLLMQGCGVSFSVEQRYISKLPRIKMFRGKKEKYRVEDTTEAWCDSIHFGMQRLFDGWDVEYDYSPIRTKGTPLKTKGGRASGPDPLHELHDFMRQLFMARQGGVLTDLDCHDIGCYEGSIVQVGGVRRASCLSASDLNSHLMRNAKSGDWYPSKRWRSMANNSAVYESTPTAVEFMEEWLALVKSNSGERGIFNREAARKNRPRRRADCEEFCTNPCAEIILRPREFCNLSIAVARPNDTPETLRKKVRVATIFGCMQSTLTNFRYIRDRWRENCQEEALIGVDINGQIDCPLLRPRAPGRQDLVLSLANDVHRLAEEYSQRFGINRPAADTTIKPSGDSAVFFGCNSGLTPRHAKYIIRWVREDIDSPVARFLRDSGVPCAPAPEAPERLLVFGFPVKAPEGSPLREDYSALDMLKNWLFWKNNWSEHSVSCTVHVKPEEWLEAGNWVYNHFDQITGLSFMPTHNSVYKYTPNEEITEAQYLEAVAKFPKLNWAKLSRYEQSDMTQGAQTPACTGGTCELS